jgi:hypothetical protein
MNIDFFNSCLIMGDTASPHALDREQSCKSSVTWFSLSVHSATQKNCKKRIIICKYSFKSKWRIYMQVHSLLLVLTVNLKSLMHSKLSGWLTYRKLVTRNILLFSIKGKNQQSGKYFKKINLFAYPDRFILLCVTLTYVCPWKISLKWDMDKLKNWYFGLETGS